MTRLDEGSVGLRRTTQTKIQQMIDGEFRKRHSVLHTTRGFGVDQEYRNCSSVATMNREHDRPYQRSWTPVFACMTTAEGWLGSISGTGCPRASYDGIIAGYPMPPMNVTLLKTDVPVLRANFL
eukprot:TRINITY_DN2386_c0_g2_i11.p1 TRINITY_DN2386_c0_g2~~TRINITY_DN2386_c0_g2_i11.p1  ORF type:complete len:124 (+),score=4.55 TRINITY_DN2386_c0_g2_i11:644-1015(+)